MRKEMIQDLLVRFGFAETLNKVMLGVNLAHVIPVNPDGAGRLVEYYADPAGIVRAIWVFDMGPQSVGLIESVPDFEIWLGGY